MCFVVVVDTGIVVLAAVGVTNGPQYEFKTIKKSPENLRSTCANNKKGRGAIGRSSRLIWVQLEVDRFAKLGVQCHLQASHLLQPATKTRLAGRHRQGSQFTVMPTQRGCRRFDGRRPGRVTV